MPRSKPHLLPLAALSALLLLGITLVVISSVAEVGKATSKPRDDAARGLSPTVSTSSSSDEKTSGDEVRQAVVRALPYLEQQGVAWMEKHQCVSCHQIPAMLWSFNEAESSGLPVDRAKLEAWNRWSIEKSKEAGVSNSDGIGQLILGRNSYEEEAQYRALAAFITQAQEADGSWHAGGQLPLQRRPADESHRVSTLWSLLALSSIEGEDEALERGRQYAAACQVETGQSHEWWIVRLLYEHRFGSMEKARTLLAEMVAEQNEDGGWSFLRGEPSDAFATGQTLYALGRLGWTETSEVAERARRFLLATQKDNGSWTVRSTLSREHEPTPTSNYWGTGWAVIGLLRSLPIV